MASKWYLRQLVRQWKPNSGSKTDQKPYKIYYSRVTEYFSFRPSWRIPRAYPAHATTVKSNGAKLGKRLESDHPTIVWIQLKTRAPNPTRHLRQRN